MKSKTLAPIVLFTYNRLWHTQQTVEALLKNNLAKDSDLFIFADGAKSEADQIKVQSVRNYLTTIDGFKSITIEESPTNKGLANSIIYGVTKIVNQFGKIIVLEDDLVTSRYFLKYMNSALSFYETDLNVGSIHGHIYNLTVEFPEVFFIKKSGCLGWGTWKRCWDLFDIDADKLAELIKKNKLVKEFNNENSYNHYGELVRQANGDSTAWAARFYASLFLHNKLTLYPGKSFVQHIGLNGEHFSGFNQKDPKNGEVFNYNSYDFIGIPSVVDADSYKKIISYYRTLKTPIFVRVYRKFIRILRMNKCLKK